ncbi:superoxide dismutase family protein [Allokutzneria albata]|uniref:Superoxide dismutase, Cu-Zn family n=1 Tax=Allokutzneria albata TaxID=211114 RepID=A0A1G9RP93_ALLAB|nr:superoxide dismutase family protein [Allokutzneria albata]SDM24245.1 superoxide dismutase, Cu-Zn family [Allokutzneria albata]
MSRSLLTMAVLVSTALITACSQPDKPANTPPSSASDLPKPAPAEFTGTLAAPGSGTAFSYNPAAPIGAQLTVKITSGEGSTTVDFSAKGMQPSRGYAVHAHTKPCGATGADAGPHYQNTIDPAATPEKPSADPAYANPRNEIWLDFRTDAQGAGSSKTTVPFGFTDRAPASIVVHEKETTATHHGQAGTAGGRLACFTVPFKQ